MRCVWEFAPREGDATPIDVLTIRGTGGALEMAAMGAAAPVRVLSADGALVRELTFAAPEHAAQPLIQSATDELRGVRGARCKSRADNAVRTSRALDAALEAFYGGREDEFWTRV